MDAEELLESWDSRREENQKRFEKHFPQSDDLLAIVLRGHLLLEEYLDRLNSHCFHSPEYYDQAHLSFSKKLLITQAQVRVPHPNPDGFFNGLKKLNELRNNLAHNLESPKLKIKVNAFLKAVESEYPSELPEGLLPENRTIEARTRSSICYLMGQMNVLDNVVEFMEKSRHYGNTNGEHTGA